MADIDYDLKAGWDPADPELQRVLALAIHQPTPERLLARLEDWRGQGAWLFEARREGWLAGALVILPASGQAATVLAIAVVADWRKTGIGRGLLAAARQAIPSEFRAETDAEASGFYAKAGFRTEAFIRVFCGAEIQRWSCVLPSAPAPAEAPPPEENHP
jgi:GNAT superfamily N-acetyltransferase